MKKLIYLIVIIGVLALIVVGCTNSVVPPAEQNVSDDKGGGKPTKCATIQDGTIYAKDGTLIETGYDDWGYNYQAHLFNGFYWNNGRKGDDGIPWTKETIDDAPSKTWLVMKWNDAWLSNKDCVGDGKLDRHFGFDSYVGSGAWLTNHQSGFTDEDYIVDVLNIGDLDSEVGHNLEGWSNPWIWGGNYGGGDDGTLRLLVGPGDPCEDINRDAYFTMDTQGAAADKLILRHLDGSAIDSFDVSIWNGIDWDPIGSYTAVGGGEHWVTSDFAFTPRSGELKFKLVATGNFWNLCGTYGQVAFSWAELEGPCYWNYFCKIVVVPEDAINDGGVWYTADGTEIGPVIWGVFAIIQEVYNDLCAGDEGILYKSPAGPGLGKWESGIPE